MAVTAVAVAVAVDCQGALEGSRYELLSVAYRLYAVETTNNNGSSNSSSSSGIRNKEINHE